MHSTYVLFISEKLGKRYMGASEAPFERLAQHNAGKAKFSSRGAPWTLKYIEYYATRKECMARERFLMTGAGRIFLNRLLKRAEGYPERELPDHCLEYRIL
ncbi:MAG: GIY-YIG nuclease family protein [Lentisphaerae bacterium]|nr:GIY-YIG nuclease family protein [Lentisphaerota bacterium]